MRKIDLLEVDAALQADMGTDVLGFEAFEASYPEATVSNQGYHLVYNQARGRGGIVMVGSGSNGNTFWTDAMSVHEVLHRCINDELTG